jgi:Ca2+/H+ antiporter, TMEM165/GDT1 family
MSWLEPGTIAVAFGVILLAELPDKTMIATVILAGRYRRLPVWLGVSAALGVQAAVAVAAGGLLSLLPQRITLALTAALFGVGAVLMITSGLRSRHAPTSDIEATTKASGFWRIAAISFGLLFLAEWGDLSQLFTAGLAAQTGAPVSVFIGAWAALLTVSGLGVLLGTWLSDRVPLWLLRLGSGIVLAGLTVWSILEWISAG